MKGLLQLFFSLNPRKMNYLVSPKSCVKQPLLATVCTQAENIRVFCLTYLRPSLHTYSGTEQLSVKMRENSLQVYVVCTPPKVELMH